MTAVLAQRLGPEEARRSDVDQPEPPEPTAPDWRRSAACAGEDVETFYDPQLAGDAKAICRRCPVAADCLEESLLRGDRDAVLGGLDPDERRELVRLARWLTAA